MFLFNFFLVLSLESSAEVLFYNLEKQKNAFLPTWKSRISITSFQVLLLPKILQETRSTIKSWKFVTLLDWGVVLSKTSSLWIIFWWNFDLLFIFPSTIDVQFSFIFFSFLIEDRELIYLKKKTHLATHIRNGKFPFCHHLLDFSPRKRKLLLTSLVMNSGWLCLDQNS